jgi:inosose dehydratase
MSQNDAFLLRTTGDSMSKIKIGNAPDSWGVWFPKNEMQVEWSVFLDEVAESGYRYIELGPWGYLPTDKATLQAELDKRDLKLVASTVFCNLIEESSVLELIHSLDEIAELQKSLGAEYVVLLPPMITDLFSGEVVLKKELSTDERKTFNSNVERIGKIVTEKYGLTLTVHPHVDSHLETEDDIENLLINTSSQYVSLCLDIGHHAYGGGDPCQFIIKHNSRIPYIHLKNCDGVALRRMKENGWSFAEAVRHDIMCEPWKGIVDFTMLKAVLDEVGYSGFAVVEQDMYPAAPGRPLKVAKETREFLTKVGIG